MARKLTKNVYVADPDTGDVVGLKAGTVPPARFKGVLGAHVFGDDDGEVAADAPAPPGGVTGQDPDATTAALAEQARAEAEAVAAAGAVVDGAVLVDGTIEDVLKRVGDDKDLAGAALDAERAKGDAARSTLIEKLEAITQVNAGT